MFNVKRLFSRLSIFSYVFYGRNSQNALSKWEKKNIAKIMNALRGS